MDLQLSLRMVFYVLRRTQVFFSYAEGNGYFEHKTTSHLVENIHTICEAE